MAIKILKSREHVSQPYLALTAITTTYFLQHVTRFLCKNTTRLITFTERLFSMVISAYLHLIPFTRTRHQ